MTPAILMCGEYAGFVVLKEVATYRRSLLVSEARVWENVYDWEHLPWLHRESFSHIELEEAGVFGWRARVGVRAPASELRLELLVDRAVRRYVTRTVEGSGRGSEIWTRVVPAGVDRTDVEVTFHLPDVTPEQGRALGDYYVALYERLWDEDEAMMRGRSASLARRAAPKAACLDLGCIGALRARLPAVVALAGRRFRIVSLGEELVAHETTCPHWLGPLDETRVEDGCITCPWHGYQYEPSGGRSPAPFNERIPT